jgi:hypothetical protein
LEDAASTTKEDFKCVSKDILKICHRVKPARALMSEDYFLIRYNEYIPCRRHFAQGVGLAATARSFMERRDELYSRVRVERVDSGVEATDRVYSEHHAGP